MEPGLAQAFRPPDQPAEEQPTADRQREPGDDGEREKEIHCGTAITVGIGPDGYVLKATFLPGRDA